MVAVARPRIIPRVKAGDELRTEVFNRSIDVLNKQGKVEPPEPSPGLTPDSEGDAAEIDAAPDEQTPAPTGAIWAFVSKTTRTERIEDDDDATVFVDVLVTTSVTVRGPDSEVMTIQLEAPESG